MESDNKITNSGDTLTVILDVYLFMEGDTYIAYSPALDLSGYGTTEQEARQSFSIVLDEYISHGLSHRTLLKDLRAHGWKVRSWAQRKMSAPSFDNMIQNNDLFKDILRNKEYRKISEPFPFIA